MVRLAIIVNGRARDFEDEVREIGARSSSLPSRPSSSLDCGRTMTIGRSHETFKTERLFARLPLCAAPMDRPSHGGVLLASVTSCPHGPLGCEAPGGRPASRVAAARPARHEARARRFHRWKHARGSLPARRAVESGVAFSVDLLGEPRSRQRGAVYASLSELRRTGSRRGAWPQQHPSSRRGYCRASTERRFRSALAPRSSLAGSV